MELRAIITKLEKDIDTKKALYNNGLGQKQSLEKAKKKKEIKLEESKVETELLEQVNLFLQRVSEYAREQARRQIERIVTLALQLVFGEGFSFKIEIEEKNNKPSAEFYVVSEFKDYKIKNKPQEARGGGVVDVVSLALRVAVLELQKKPALDGPLVLDEPAKHVSEEYITDVTRFLRNINQRFERQIIIVTHKQHLSQMADKAFKVELEDGVSAVSSG